MSREEFLQQTYDLGLQSGMNQRYHQLYAARWWLGDTVTKVLTAIAAVAGALLAIATAGASPDPNTLWWSVALSIAAAICAVALNVLPFGTWEQRHRDFFRQWTDLRGDVDALEYELCETPSDGNLCDLKKLNAKMHRICGEEPSPNRRVLAECHRAEKRSRQWNPAAEPSSFWSRLFART